MELYLIAHIAGRGVAIPTEQVDSVVDLGDVVAVPCAVSSVRGLSALRSRVLTVIDTGTALGIEPMPDSCRRAVITRIDGHHYAVLVDSLDDVARYEPLSLSSGLSLQHGWASAGRGLVDRDGDPLLVLDLAALVPGTHKISAAAA
ncbi:chemotaxis protein CheW [Sphingomonas aerophila]|uniref:Purine-binding chemotaxis protein CheW n=1 Tax=Sphingomonas aerophila TaxID=1344948 RepID=A0A7W9BDX1_9SPHN|nr:chemotaxis protein CheW [Sphingomonas aerophila]MBB5715367.1 purine-binding chemotaxis protein CheW [Sphingomonas aerophila]